MRDADDDEETRLFSGSADAALASPSLPPSPSRAAGLPPPRVDSEVLPPPGAALAANDDDDATRLMSAAPAPKQHKWLVSDGPNAPVDLSHNELRAALTSGKVSGAALAWQKGMREWQKVGDIPTLNGALPPRSSPRSSSPRSSSPRSSPPPQRTSRPRSEPSAPRPSKLVTERPPSPLAAALAADAAGDFDISEADTPPSGSLLLSASVSTADFSEITPAHTPQSQRAQQLASASPLVKPERIEIASLPLVSAGPARSAKLEKPKASLHTPRPAAGRPPEPGEPVAKTPAAPDTQVALDAKVVINEPPAAVLATGLAQAKLNPTIETQREATQPARWRPPLRQLRAAGQPPNVVLWVLGAGGWVLSGVLAGILLAKSDPEPVRASTTAATIATHAALTREQSDRPPRATRPAAPAAPEAAPVPPDTAAAPTAPESAVNSTALAPQTPNSNVGSRSGAKPVMAKPPTVAAARPELADPSGLSGPTSTKDINTPGF